MLIERVPDAVSRLRANCASVSMLRPSELTESPSRRVDAACCALCFGAPRSSRRPDRRRLATPTRELAARSWSSSSSQQRAAERATRMSRKVTLALARARRTAGSSGRLGAARAPQSAHCNPNRGARTRSSLECNGEFEFGPVSLALVASVALAAKQAKRTRTRTQSANGKRIAESREQKAERREQKAESREQRAKSRAHRADCRLQSAQ